MIRVDNIHKAFGNLLVLKGISLNINARELVSITGASGAGKSTLLHILGTLEKPDKGKLMFNNSDPFMLSENKLSAFRNKEIGFVFQFHHLLPEFTALENVSIPALIAKKAKKEAEKQARALLDQLGLNGRLHHKPSELSGGEQQRVAVARALINNPAVILADEPSGNLDSAAAKDLHQLFFDLRKQSGQTFVIVTHNMELAAMADRCLRIKDGIIVDQN